MTVIRNWKKALITDLNNIAVELKEAVEHPAVIILDGPVGAGKTTFTRVLLEEKKEAPSPTYSIINEIDNYLRQGITVLAQVDQDPSTSQMDQHWIQINGKDGDDYIANDPLTGTRISFRSVYGDPARWIFRIRVYRNNKGV